jgi:hypothetical protein
MKRLLTVALCTVPLAANADQTVTKPMTFEKCLATIQLTATRLGVAPVNIVETSILRMVRFPASDGSTLVTCSAPDNKMVIVQTSKVCGVDVEC